MVDAGRDEPTGIRLRSPDASEAAAIADVLNACAEADVGAPDSNEVEVRRMWTVGHIDLATDAWVAESIGEGHSALAGYVQVEIAGPGGEPWIDGYTHPSFRGRGIGARLLRAAETRARTAAAATGSLDPPVARHGAGAGTNGVRFLESQGYRAIRTSLRMRVDMERSPSAPAWPEGITVEGFERGRDEERFHACLEDAFRDHWGWTARPLAEWVKHKITAEADFDGSLWFRAMDGSDVAGAIIGRPRAPEDADSAWIGDLGVRREWRRRGVGLALLVHEFGELYRRGARAVMLSVDGESLTGATRLYERAGMRTVQRIDIFEKALTNREETGATRESPTRRTQASR